MLCVKHSCRWGMTGNSLPWLTAVCLKRFFRSRGWQRPGLGALPSHLLPLGEERCDFRKSLKRERVSWQQGSCSSSVPFSTWFLHPTFSSSQKFRAFVKAVMGWADHSLGLRAHPWTNNPGMGFLMHCVGTQGETPQVPWCLTLVSVKKHRNFANA